MKLFSVKIASLLILVLFGMNLGQAYAAGSKNTASKAAKLKQAYVWYDGEQERQIWLDPSLVAEFHAGKVKAAESPVKSVYADAVPVSKRYGAVRLWKLGAYVSSETAVKTLAEANQAGSYSSVLRDGPTTSGRMRALPGNIIVYLNPSWDTAAVNAWATQHNFEIVKKLEIGTNIFVIKTGPGLEALNTANALYKSGEVVAAFPDWWVEVTTR